MVLLSDEIKKIDSALDALSESMEDDLQGFSGLECANFDDPFLKSIVPHYFPANRAMMLSADSRRLNKAGGTDCVCGCSCAKPEKGQVTW
jgi:hypothetical protein